MGRNHVLVTAPTEEPFTVQYVKDHLRFSALSNDEDHLVDLWIRSARQRAETATGRQLLTATWDLKLECFDSFEIELTRPPLQSVTSITYRDTSGTPVVIAGSEYYVEAPGGPTAPGGRIRPVFGSFWPPTLYGAFDAVTIRIVCGYGSEPESIPEPIMTAMLIMIGDLAEGRQSPQRLTGGAATLADDVAWRLSPYVWRSSCEAAA